MTFSECQNKHLGVNYGIAKSRYVYHVKSKVFSGRTNWTFAPYNTNAANKSETTDKYFFKLLNINSTDPVKTFTAKNSTEKIFFNLKSQNMINYLSPKLVKTNFPCYIKAVI